MCSSAHLLETNDVEGEQVSPLNSRIAGTSSRLHAPRRGGLAPRRVRAISLVAATQGDGPPDHVATRENLYPDTRRGMFGYRGPKTNETPQLPRDGEHQPQGMNAAASSWRTWMKSLAGEAEVEEVDR